MNKSLKTYAIIVLGLLLSTTVVAQDTLILRGKVLNDAKEAVKDVTINTPGGIPSYTDENGAFELKYLSTSKWVTVRPSDIYGTKQFYLKKGQDNITIYVTRKTLDSRFDEISMGENNVLRRDIISAHKTLNTKKFDEQSYNSIEQYMQGKVSGAFVTTNSGMPGSGGTVFLRGFSSIMGNNQPLYVIDGIPLEDANIYNEIIEGFNYNPLSTIDPMDISEITILKDASATALYGAKGANGVIYIKTLQAKEDKTIINVSLKTGISLYSTPMEQLNSKGFKNLANELLFSSGQKEEYFKPLYPGLYYTPEDDEYQIYDFDTDWQKLVYQNARSNNMRFEIKGGDNIAKYGLSLGYLNQEGIFNNTSLNRFNIRLVGSFGIFDWLNMNVSTNLATGTSKLKESAKSAVSNPIMSSLAKSPLLNPYEFDENGEILGILDETREFDVSNPLAVSDMLKAEAKNYRFITTLSFDGDITEKIKFKSVFGLNSNNIKEFLFIPDNGFSTMYNSEADNVSKAQSSTLFSFYNDNKIFYESPAYSSKHSSDHYYRFGIGMRWQQTKYEQDAGIGKNTPSDEYTTIGGGDALLREILGANRKWNWGATYADAAYSFKDKYIANAIVSADISSRIGKNAINTIAMGDVPVGLFYSAGLAWRISEESFLSNMNAVEELKLRASYGIAGNDDVGETNSYSHFNIDNFRQTSVLVPGRPANTELGFQMKSQMNVGLDFSVFANRLSFTFDYFNNTSSQLMILEPINSYLGFSSFPSNAATIATSGIETDLFCRLISKKDFTFDFGLNFSKYNSVIDEISGGEQITDGFGGFQVINKVGEAPNSFYGYKFKGVYSTQKEANDANLSSDRGVQYGAGDAIFENLPGKDGNLDNRIDKFDKQILGSFEPDFYGGAYVNANYKGLSVNLFFQGVYGNEVYNFVRYQNEKMTDLSNQSVKVLQRWQYEGQKTTIPKATMGDPAGNNSFSDRWIDDGSYLRLKELTIAYNIKQNLVPLNGLKVFATATNLLTFSKYKGIDPESSYNTDMISQGVDYGNMPLSRQFVIGVKIGL